jgi:hypothetical protein
MMADFGFWILDFGLGFRVEGSLHAEGERFPCGGSGIAADWPLRLGAGGPIQNSKFKIQNPPRRSAADGL